MFIIVVPFVEAEMSDIGDYGLFSESSSVPDKCLCDSALETNLLNIAEPSKASCYHSGLYSQHIIRMSILSE